jgi:energy-coupling factor transport system substrate-specific component
MAVHKNQYIQEAQMENKSLWKFGTREVVYAAIGAALYAVLSFGTNFLQLPAAGNVAIRPGIVIPLFFGIAFGPIVGFITGFLGNIIGDLLSAYGFWIWWDLGNGLIGLVAGFAAWIVSFKSGKSILKAEIYTVIAVIVGMGVASLSEMWVSGADMNTVIFANFIPSAVTNLVNGLILVPILMYAYDAVVSRSGR